MASALYGEHNAIRARFQLHPRSSDQDLRVALKLAEQQQRLLRSGRTTRRNYADVKDKIYTIQRHNGNGARRRPPPPPDPMHCKSPQDDDYADVKDKIYTISRHNGNGAGRRHPPPPDPMHCKSPQDDDINRLARCYSFSSEDRKQEASLVPISRVDMGPSPSYHTTTVPNVINPPSQQYKTPPIDKTRPNISPKEQKKAEKRLQKELEEKAKLARKKVKTDIKDEAKKSRKRLKATYKTASGNPEGFVAWAEAYQRLGEITDKPTDESPKTGSMQWLKSLWPRRRVGRKSPPEWKSPPEVPAYSPHMFPSELPADERAELPANESVQVSYSGRPGNQAAASSKGKARVIEVTNGESSERVPWILPPSPAMATPSNARIHASQDFSLLDSSLSESRSQTKISPTSTSEAHVSEAETAQAIKQYLTQEKDFLRDEIGRLGAQAAAKLRQCATEMEQAEGLRNADLKRALSQQHQRHAQELEKFTTALNILQDQGKRGPQKPHADGHKEHEASGEVLKTRELSVTRREQDVVLQLREALQREKVVVLREREAASREREAASREREAASREREATSLAADALSQAHQPMMQGKFLLSEDQLPPVQKQSTSPPMGETSARTSDAGLKIKAFSLRSSKIRTREGTKDASKRPQAPPTSQLAGLSLRAAPDMLEPLLTSTGVDTETSFDHEEPRALHQLAKMFVDQVFAEILSLKGAGVRSHAVPKRKSASSATFTRASGQPRPRSGHSAGRAVNKGKDKELSEDEGDSDEEPRKRRRRNPPVWDSQQRILACPYSKYDICRYSEMNVTEKSYRGCTSCFLTDISRLKQHLYRVHRRPENYCPRCFEVFQSDILLDEHARQLISCKVTNCPFPERMTDGQVKGMKKKWTGKSTEQCWYFIFKILFPDAPRPLSPYAEDKSSVIVQIEAHNAPQLISRLFRERLSQLDRTPVTAQLWLAEVQALLGQVVEDSMEELLRRSTRLNSSNSDPGSTSSKEPVSSSVQDSELDQSCHLRVSSEAESNQQAATYPNSPNESVACLLDLDTGITDVDNSTFENVAALESSQLDDFPCSPSQVEWSETSYPRTPEGDILAVSQWHLDRPGPSLTADTASDAAFGNSQVVKANDNNHSSTRVHQMPVSVQSPELLFPESSSHVTVPPASGSMGPPPSQNTKSSQDPPIIPKTLQTKRSQRSLDSGYGSILTPQQSHASSNNSTENLTYPDSGFFNTLAQSWEPIGADEEAFVERARTSARTPYFSESTAVDHPFVTY